MGFDIQLESRSGNPAPDKTADRWNSNFITTVNNKAKGWFDVPRYKGIILNADKWGQGTIRYKDPFRPNGHFQFLSGRRVDNGNVFYDITVPDHSDWGDQPYYVIDHMGRGVLHRTSPYVNKRTKNLNEYVHIWNIGGHNVHDFGSYPYGIVNPNNYRGYAGVYEIDNSLFKQIYINQVLEVSWQGYDREAGKIAVNGTGLLQYMRYVFSNGVEGYTDANNNGHEFVIPESLRNDPNAWVKIVGNSESSSYPNRPNSYYAESQKIPFNVIKRFNGNYNMLFTGIDNGRTTVHAALVHGTFNPNASWYIYELYGFRSGNDVTLRFKYISNGRVDRVILKNNNTEYTAISAPNGDNVSQVTVNTPDRGLYLIFYCNGRPQSVAIYV